MKARVWGLVLATAMTVSLTGCGGNADTKTQAASGQTVSKENNAAVAESAESTEDAEKEEALIPVSFRLNYTAAGLHAPFYYALEKGYYEEVGLDVTIGEGTGSGTTAKLVGTGGDDLGLVDSASVASAVANDIPIKIVCPIYAVNGFSVITPVSYTHLDVYKRQSWDSL